ncbi:hypothetical protein [Saccharopolyspora cebuensis]|uniref:Uncharacterized protein n=1 Tax=Saccharopolyspora cebuensis TaxID=418759 RepID=A0ABV4CJI2_9PSEU
MTSPMDPSIPDASRDAQPPTWAVLDLGDGFHATEPYDVETPGGSVAVQAYWCADEGTRVFLTRRGPSDVQRLEAMTLHEAGITGAALRGVVEGIRRSEEAQR